MGRHSRKHRKRGKDYCPTPDKKGFINETQAELALLDIWSKPYRTWYPVRWYRCVCKRYHLTEKPKGYD